MIDNFALALTHGLMLLAALRLWHRDDLDREPSPRDPAPRDPAPRDSVPPAGTARRWGRRRA